MLPRGRQSMCRHFVAITKFLKFFWRVEIWSVVLRSGQ